MFSPELLQECHAFLLNNGNEQWSITSVSCRKMFLFFAITVWHYAVSFQSFSVNQIPLACTARWLRRPVWRICTSITGCFWNFRDAGARFAVHGWYRHHCCDSYGQHSRSDCSQRLEHCLLEHWTRFEIEIQPLLSPESTKIASVFPKQIREVSWSYSLSYSRWVVMQPFLFYPRYTSLYI